MKTGLLFIGFSFMLSLSYGQWVEEADVATIPGMMDLSNDDELGGSVAISYHLMAVGAPSSDLFNNEAGAVSIYVFNGNTWDEDKVLPDHFITIGDKFGYSVAISSNTLVIGAPDDDDLGINAGAVYIYSKTAGVWNMDQKLFAPNGDADDNFGHAVSIDDSTIVVGSPLRLYGSGSANVFIKENGSWIHQQQLNLQDPDPDDTFGYSVCVKNDQIVVGALNDDNGSSSGSASIFERNGTTWSFQQRILAPDQPFGRWFGSSVGIFNDRALIGASGDDENGSTAGAVYSYMWNGSSWIFVDKLLPNLNSIGARFGISVGMWHHHAIVGSYGSWDIGTHSGIAYFYDYDGNSWQQSAIITPSDGEHNDEFGYSVGIDEDRVVVGAPNHEHSGIRTGSAYVYINSNLTGISSQSESSFVSIVPNPNNGEFLLKWDFDEIVMTAEVIDMFGKVKHRIDTNSNIEEISISLNISPGTYLIQLHTKTSVHIKKLIVT